MLEKRVLICYNFIVDRGRKSFVPKEYNMKHISTIAKTERKSAVMGCGECQSSCQSACKTSCTVGNQTCKQEERINKIEKKENI